MRTDDLRFTGEEAATFLREAMALDLSIADIHALESHTEGWVAGLQLAAALLVAPITGPHLKSRRAVITQRSSGWATPGKQ